MGGEALASAVQVTRGASCCPGQQPLSEGHDPALPRHTSGARFTAVNALGSKMRYNESTLRLKSGDKVVDHFRHRSNYPTKFVWILVGLI